MEPFGPEDHDLLVKIVKEAQRRGLAGSKGPWKTFLASLPRGDPSKPIQNDPARRDWETLAAFCASLAAEDDVELVQRMRGWHAWHREEERVEREDPFPQSPEQALVARTRAHSTYKQSYDLPGYQEGWALSKRGAVSDAPPRTRLLSVDCEMCKAEGNPKELVRLSVVDQNLKVLLSEFVKPTVKVLDYRTEITGASAKALEKVTYTHADAQKAVLELLSEPGTILVGHGLQHDLRALKIDHRRVTDTSLIFSYEGLRAAIPALGDLCRAVLEVGFREGGAQEAHDSIEDAKIPMRLTLHEIKNGPTGPLKAPDIKVDKSELSKLFLHRIPKGTPREVLARAFPPDLGAHVQMVTWGGAGTGTTFVLFKNPEVANTAFKGISGKENKDALGRAQKSVTILPPADDTDGQKVTFTVRKMGCHNGAAFGAKGKGTQVIKEVKEGVSEKEKEAKSKKEKVKKRKEKEANGTEIAEGKVTGGLEERVTKRRKNDKGGSDNGLADGLTESAKKKQHGKSSAERRKAQRALKLGKGENLDNISGGKERAPESRTRSAKEGQDASAKGGSDPGKKVKGRKDRETKGRDRQEEGGGASARKQAPRSENVVKKRKSLENGEDRHRRHSLDGDGSKRKRTGTERNDRNGTERRGTDRIEKRARKSEPTATQQTLKEIQRLLASVGNSSPSGTESGRGRKRERESSEGRNKSKSAHKERDSSRSRHKERRGEKEKSTGKQSPRRLKQKLAEKDDQVAALTKLVLEMAKGKAP